MDAERVVCVFLAVLIALGVGAGLGSGKMLFLSWFSFPGMVSRRKEPLDFWLAIAFFGVFVGLCVWGAIRR
jgi:hypothetical protein